jgi:hypothetical protein
MNDIEGEKPLLQLALKIGKIEKTPKALTVLPIWYINYIHI